MNWNLFNTSKSYLDRLPSLPKMPSMPELPSMPNLSRFSNVPSNLRETFSLDNRYIRNKWVLIISGLALLLIILKLLNYLSYHILKDKIIARQEWDLNICCGKTDGGGINADIFPHIDIPNFLQIDDVYNLPFQDESFESVLCSHTIEHVDDPRRFYNELKRVGRDVTLIVPPLWDIASALNIFKHRHVFLTCRKVHKELPVYVRLPFAGIIQRLFGRRIHA